MLYDKKKFLKMSREEQQEVLRLMNCDITKIAYIADLLENIPIGDPAIREDEGSCEEYVNAVSELIRILLRLNILGHPVWNAVVAKNTQIDTAKMALALYEKVKEDMLKSCKI